jgi:flagellar L-ring protein precursor FlgH
MHAKVLVLAVMGLLIWSVPAASDSIWARAQPRWKSLFADFRAREVGDLVTVVVTESTAATTQVSTDVNKKSGMEGTAGSGLLEFIPLMGYSYKDDYASKGETARRNTFATRVAAQVVERLPNGNLRIEALRAVVVGEERQTLRLTGVVRPEDVSADNTVLSTQIAEARITLEGQGPAARKQRPGLLSRLFDWLF